MNLLGQSIVGGVSTTAQAEHFSAFNPATGQPLGPPYFCASLADLDRAAQLAEESFATYGHLSGHAKGIFLRTIADALQAASEQLVERAHLETALPRPRLQGEVVRTANQLRLFADVVEEGSWVMARLDSPDPDRKPLPRPDLRSMLRPLGPVAVFGASNFPLAFSVAGGDTASALAAGNPVIVKAHPAHPGTSELVGQMIASCVRSCGLPPGVFSLLFDSGTAIGQALVQHPLIRAVGFTGSLAAGRVLMDLAASRPDPIPCFTEMSSVNPVFILPQALRQRGVQIASGLHASVTLGAGQFCTKPGLVFLPRQQESADLQNSLRDLFAATPSFTMLTAGIAAHYGQAAAQRLQAGHAALVATADATGAAESDPVATAARAMIFNTSAAALAADPTLSEEIFGPATLLVHYADRQELLQAAHALRGHLTATLFGDEEELAQYADLAAILERKAGRLLCNAYPTGVEVSHAMVHGGPYPATSDGRSTSVGSQAIFRFARPVCYQGFVQDLLPAELKQENPLGILRMVNGAFTRN